MEDRIKILKSGSEYGRFIIYWMQGSQRTSYNHSLEYAILESNRLEKPLLVVFNIFDDYPEANYRHYYFMIEGLLDVKRNLEKKGIDFIITYGDLVDNITTISRDASILICDKGYMKNEKNWRESISKNILCTMVEVESNLIVPVEVTSPKEEYSARTIRLKINRILDNYLYDFQYEEYIKDKNKEFIEIFKKSIEKITLPLKGTVKDICSLLKIDTSLDKVDKFKGGEVEAQKKLDEFIEGPLDKYDTLGSHPESSNVSYLSPYLHFGNISPMDVAQRIIKERATGNKESINAYLEELIIRRELSFNFIYYNENYDNWEGITYPWAYESLRIHSVDEREFLYSLDELEEGKTHDIYWNAAQNEMIKTGFMHGYLRMYWCKKILEWSPTPKKAYQTTIYLNNKYFLDGRDPNSYTGVAWCFGKHDRAWKERAIYGKVRCMVASGLKRKFNMKEYISMIEKL